jgi:hypothetical protein
MIGIIDFHRHDELSLDEGRDGERNTREPVDERAETGTANHASRDGVGENGLEIFNHY